MQVERNCVYLIPPNRNLRLFHGRLLLSYLKHPFANKDTANTPVLNDDDGLSRIFALLREANGGSLRLWVAGCSTGEEAYSIALLCSEVMDHAGLHCDVKIFATDVDRDAILEASNGFFAESAIANIEPQLLSKHFYHKEEGFQIREMVVFAQHNLVKDPPFTNIDLISCRNLLIYLQPVLQRRVLELFNFSLNAQGILMLGSSETTGEMSDYFEPLDQKWRIYRSRGRRRHAELSEPAATFDPSRWRSAMQPMGRGTIRQLHEEERLLERLLDGISGDYLPFCMVVSETMELMQVVGDASPYLRFPTGKVINDVTKLIHNDLSIPLSTGLQKVFKNREELNYTNIHLRQDDGSQVINMRLKPLPTKKTQVALIAVFIELERKETTAERLHPETYDIGREAKQRITDLDNLLINSGVAALFIDENLDLRRFTPETGRLLQLVEQDLGRPLSRLKCDHLDQDLFTLAKLMQELQIHQIELEMQNEELRESQLQLEEFHQQYLDLYNDAPVGYASLDDSGMILRCNRTLIELLGTEDQIMQGHALVEFMLEADQPIFRSRFRAFSHKPESKHIDVRFKYGGRRGGDTSFVGHIQGRRLDSYGRFGARGWKETLLVVISDVTELKDSEEKIAFQAYHDSLTGLPNRTQLHDRLETTLALGARHASSSALLFMDLDRFKTINDSLADRSVRRQRREASQGSRTGPLLPGLRDYRKPTAARRRDLSLSNATAQGIRTDLLG